MIVTLRRKKLAKGRISLYLEIYTNGKRHYEFLKLYLEKNQREQNKETQIEPSFQTINPVTG